MKSLIKLALAIGAVVFTCSTSFATYSRTTSNGGPNGFDVTFKNVDGSGNVFIDCENPGFTGCPTSVAGMNSEYLTLADYALAQIAAGTTSGSHSDTSGGITYTVTWSGTNLKNCTVGVTP